MSVDYYVGLMLGCRFEAKELEIKEKVHSCNHTSSIGKNYCPDCGMKVEETERVIHDCHDLYFDNKNIVVEHSTDSKYIFIGLAKYSVDVKNINEENCEPLIIGNMKLAKEETKNELGKYWNEEMFAIWNTSSISY